MIWRWLTRVFGFRKVRPLSNVPTDKPERPIREWHIKLTYQGRGQRSHVTGVMHDYVFATSKQSVTKYVRESWANQVRIIKFEITGM